MNRGFSLIEMLLAMALALIVISGVVVGSGGFAATIAGYSGTVSDSEIHDEALRKAQELVEQAAATARQNYANVTESSVTDTVDGLAYLKTILIPTAYATQCKETISGTVSWTGTHGRSLSVTATTTIVDVPTMLALGGDCAIIPPASGWSNPQRFASDTYNPGKPTSIDVLQKIAYLGADKTPFFYVADTHTATQGQTSGLFLTFGNGFKLAEQPNALDAIQYTSSGTTYKYVYAAMASSTKQLQVINVTDSTNPVLVASRQLANVDSTGSFPQGWLVYYYKDRLYITTRETAGREFHIFDVSTPTNPVELGGGTALDITVNDMTIAEQTVGGVTKRYAYLATAQDSAELKVYDVTDSSGTGTISEVTAARTNLPGNQDGDSVFVLGNKLYLGRESVMSGPDLYVYNITDPTDGITQLGSKDIGTGVISIQVAGIYGFFGTPKTNQEFQVWNISDPTNITNIATWNFGNIVSRGISYEYDFIYATGQSSPNFQIVYSP